METNQTREPWNKGKLVGQKTTTEAKGYLGHSHPSPERSPATRPGHVQPGNRQQAAGLRSCEPARPGRNARRSDLVPRDGGAAKDATAGAVRVDRADQVCRRRMD